MASNTLKHHEKRKLCQVSRLYKNITLHFNKDKLMSLFQSKLHRSDY